MAPPREEAQFAGYVATRNNETVVRWQKVQIFFLINSVLIGATVSAGFGRDLKLVVCGFGLAVTVIWWLIQWEAQNAIDYWDKVIARLEPERTEGICGFASEKPKEGFRFKYISFRGIIETGCCQWQYFVGLGIIPQ